MLAIIFSQNFENRQNLFQYHDYLSEKTIAMDDAVTMRKMMNKVTRLQSNFRRLQKQIQDVAGFNKKIAVLSGILQEKILKAGGYTDATLAILGDNKQCHLMYNATTGELDVRYRNRVIAFKYYSTYQQNVQILAADVVKFLLEVKEQDEKGKPDYWLVLPPPVKVSNQKNAALCFPKVNPSRSAMSRRRV